MGFNGLYRSGRIGRVAGAVLLCGVMIYILGEKGEGHQETTGPTMRNHPPVANDITITVRLRYFQKNRYVKLELIANDREKDSLRYKIVTFPKYGILEGAPPHLHYMPPKDFVGDDWFVYAVEDGEYSDVGTVLIQVRRRNQPPQVKDDHIRTLVGRKVYLDLLKNDWDEDGSINPASLEILHVPLHGRVRRAEDGLLYYIPNPEFEGSDYFSYRVADQEGAYSDRAQVTIDVKRINNVPVAVDDNVTIDQNRTIAIPILSNDHDGDGELVSGTLSIVEQPLHGSVRIFGDQIRYTPNPNYLGQDRFLYKVADREGIYSNAATVLILVK